MLKCCDKSIPLLAKLVDNYKKEFGSFDISSIPAIDLGCRYWAALNDTESLNKVKSVINAVPELRDGWGEYVECSFDDETLSRRLQGYIKENPGALQSKLGKALGVSGHDTTRLIGTLKNLGKIKRIKSGKTYEIYLNET